MFCALLGHTSERLQDHWSSGLAMKSESHLFFRPYRNNTIGKNKLNSRLVCSIKKK